MFDSMESAKLEAMFLAQQRRRRHAISCATTLAIGGFALSALVMGCVAQSSAGTTETGSGGWAGSTSGSSSSGAGGDVLPDAAVPPMVVDVDPGGTLDATPGGGVGVFTEYRVGGHWLVWWTCDTNITLQSCSYQLTVSAMQGAISNLQGFAIPDRISQPTSESFVVSSNTTTERDQMAFDTEPGASIELEVQLYPEPDKNFLFFVQDGKVNGGYQGSLTNPLILEPLSP